MIGRTLAHFRITAKLGEGGMGEVYRATDIELGREVAIKLLPSDLPEDSERLERFRREARLLASLGHPNIASIHQVGESHGRVFLVMELVDGEDLAAHVARGPLPLRDALRIAHQIASGLEAAHESGVIHRDLKPANVKLTPEGRIKILDFGLGKTREIADATDPDDSDLVTRSLALTREGRILGTPAYMSPEQATGQAVDKRSDIWSFGCLLYELLTGQVPFARDSLTATLTAVLEASPDWSRLPEGVPASVRRLLFRCLVRDAVDRLRDIGEARILLAEASSPDVGGEQSEASEVRRRAFPWSRLVAVASLSALAVSLLWWNRTKPEADDSAVVRLSILLPPEAPFVPGQRASLAISPQGDTIAFVGGEAAQRRLWVRPLSAERAVAIDGTAGAGELFFSPSGRAIGFHGSDRLRQVAPTGGPIQEIAYAPSVTRGIQWTVGGSILLAPNKVSPLWEISTTDGSAGPRTPDAPRDTGLVGQCWPDVLPGGDRALVSSLAVTDSSWNEARILLLDLTTGESRQLIEGGAHARYLPSGHLVFARGGTLLAAPFNLATGELTGSPVTVIDDLLTDPSTGLGHFAVSDTGTLIYARGGSRPSALRRLIWVDRDGGREALGLDPRPFLNPRLSPDGRRALLTIEAATDDIWALDVEREVLQRITFGRRHILPVWGPGKDSITFSSVRESFPLIYTASLDGRDERILAEERRAIFPGGWLPDESALVVTGVGTDESTDILLLDSAGALHPLLDSTFDESAPRLAPDGGRLAWVSNESGASEVYVARFPELVDRVQVSVGGGDQPVWSPDGETLYYRSGRRLLAIPIPSTGAKPTGAPASVFEADFAGGGALPGHPAYDVTPDGSRFLVLESDPPHVVDRLEVVLHWFEELEALVPTGS